MFDFGTVTVTVQTFTMYIMWWCAYMAAKTGQQIIGHYLHGTHQLPIVKIDELDR